MKSTRAIMVVVLVVAGSLASCQQMNRRSEHFGIRAEFHYQLERKYSSQGNELKRLYHVRMWRRYADAAKRPWLFVPRDPPEPQSWREFPRELDGPGWEPD
jgi:hypothetical protein